MSMIDKEIDHFEEILESVPFNSDCSKLFLRVYELSYDRLIQLNNHPNKFPIEGSKLLKLGISFGNLIRTYETEQALFEHQQQQQQNFMQNMKKTNVARPKSRITPPELATGTQNTDKDEPNAYSSDSIPNGMMHSYQVRFLRNLASILKSFDITYMDSTVLTPSQTRLSTGSANRKSTSMSSLPRTPPRPPSTATQISQTSGTSTVNYSPIKLTLGQLLIEKLEININLDSLFTYKIVFKLLLKIFGILRKSIIVNGIEKLSLEVSPRTSSLLASAPAGNSDSGAWESSSIFSLNSLHSQDSLMTAEEYLKLLHQVIRQISYGMMEPFILMIYHEIVEPEIHNGFGSLLDNL